MKHKIEIASNLAIYIDGERVIGSKPYGMFLTTTMIVSDDDLKRLVDRCLEVIADCKTEDSSEKPNNSTSSKMEQVEDEFKQFDREDLILLIECQKERIAELLADKDTPQTDSEITRNPLRTDCTGCKFVGWYDTDFPCVNCIRKNKDYYTSEQTEREGE